MVLPKFLQSYFWDVDFKNLDTDKYSHFILERILEYGDKKDLNWATEHLSKDAFKKTVFCSRSLSPKSANFWALILNLDKNNILCLKKSSLKKQNKIWLH